MTPTLAPTASVAALAGKAVAATKEEPFVNTLGMKFVPVPGTAVLFSIWDTRVQDYQVFANATGREWPKPNFEQGPTHPAVNVIWEDAKDFCAWLTQRERKEGKIGPDQEYRLPTDDEWSIAVGLPEESGRTPAEKSRKIKKVYPWGSQWPPPQRAGNYDRSLHVDSYHYTSPVGSFEPNKFGLYDMGGNVWQWCEDWYDDRHESRVLRGVSWSGSSLSYPGDLLASIRNFRAPTYRDDYSGFRVIVMGSAPAR